MRLAEFILANIDRILIEWDRFAESIWPEYVPIDPVALRDDAEAMLRAFATDMMAAQSATEQSDKSKGLQGSGSRRQIIDVPSALHGGGRHGSGFGLQAVIAEYRALRATVIRLWRESDPPTAPEDLEDLVRFNESIDQSLTEAIVEFTRRAEELAREGERRFREIADSAPAILWVTDGNGRCTFLSRSWFEYTGQGRAEGLGMGWLNAAHPEDRPAMERRFLHANEERKPFAIDYRLRRADGEYRWCIDAGHPRFDEGGEFVGYVGSVIDVHDRKQSELALRLSEDRMNLVRRGKSVGFWYCDLPFDVLQWDETVKEHFHLAPDAHVTIDTFWDRIHADDREPTRLAIERAIRDGRPCDIDYRTVDPKTGAIKWVRAIGRAADGDEGTPVHFDGVTLDVTDRKLTEHALRRSLETFAYLVEQSPLGIYTVDSRFRIRHVSAGSMPAFRNVDPLIGRDLGEVMHQIWHEPFATEAVEIFRRVLETGEPYVSPGMTQSRRDIDATESYEWQVNRVMLDDGGYGVVCYFFDATRLQQAHVALRESEQRFRMIADNIAQLAWTADPKGLVYWYNQRWYDYTGTTFEQMQGWGWTAVHHPDHLERVVRRVQHSWDTGELWEDTFPIRGKDGEYRWFLSRANPIRDESGKILRWFGTNTDITELRAAQAELETHRKDLERLVEERTAELEESHRKLRSSERMAALGTLSAGLGHDVGNLLVPVRISLDSLSRAELPENSRQDVEVIRTSADYLAKLSSALRQLAIEPTRSSAEDSVGVVAWWEETSPILRNILPRGVHLHARIATEECWARIARPALTQAVFNLVQNAGDAMRDRGGNVTVWMDRLEEGVRIGVTDDGPGMTEEVKARCLEPFFTTKTRGISTGMGLSLVYGLVTEAGGTIDIHSAPGRGSSFLLTLSKGAEPSARKRPLGHGRTACIDVSDPRIRALVASELRSMAFEFKQSQNGTVPDLLIVDCLERVNHAARPSLVVLLGEVNAEGQGVGGLGAEVRGAERKGVVATGARPSPRVIREAIHKVVAGGEPAP